MGHCKLLLTGLVVSLLADTSLAAAADERRSLTVAVQVVDDLNGLLPRARLRMVEPRGDDVELAVDESGIVRIPRPYHPDRDYVSFVAVDELSGRRGFLEWRYRDEFPTGPLRVVVKPAAEVLARVVDSRNAPVGDARVVLMGTLALPLAEGKTKDDGTVRLLDPADALVYSLVALKSNLGAGVTPVRFVIDPQTNEVSSVIDPLVTLAPAKRIRFRLIDSGGRPVTGLAVVPHFVNFSFRIGEGVTNAEGVVDFPWFPSERRPISLMTYSTEYGLPELIIPPADWDPDRSEGTIRVLQRTKISGRIVGSDGKPAPGIVVIAQGFDNAGRALRSAARTDAEGRYVMNVVPDRTYALAVDDADWAAVSKFGIQVVEGTPMGDLDFELTVGTIVRGIVTLGAEKSPQAYREVRIHQFVGEVFLRRGGSPDEKSTIIPSSRAPDEPQSRSGAFRRIPMHVDRVVKTDANGRYSVRVGPGDYEIVSPVSLNRFEPRVLRILRDDRDRLHHVEATDAGRRGGAGRGELLRRAAQSAEFGVRSIFRLTTQSSHFSAADHASVKLRAATK